MTNCTHPEEATIRVLEVHDRGPVVREVFLEATGSAGCEVGEVECRVHRKVESGVRQSIYSAAKRRYRQDVRILRADVDKGRGQR